MKCVECVNKAHAAQMAYQYNHLPLQGHRRFSATSKTYEIRQAHYFPGARDKETPSSPNIIIIARSNARLVRWRASRCAGCICHDRFRSKNGAIIRRRSYVWSNMRLFLHWVTYPYPGISAVWFLFWCPHFVARHTLKPINSSGA